MTGSAHSIALNTDGPREPHYVLELADGFAEIVRCLNHLTRDHAALEYPSEADHLIREIASGVSRLPQFLGQIDAWLEAEDAAERIEVPSGQYRGNPLLAVGAARLGLDAASVAAARLQEALDAVARVTCDLAARKDGSDE
jgi:hypothetical protein